MNDIDGTFSGQDIGIDIHECAAQLIGDFDLLGEWEERYRYVIELGKSLSPGGESLHKDANKVQGCVSQVWLESHTLPRIHPGDEIRLCFTGDSDAHIVRGLIAILLRLYSGRTVGEILTFDVANLFASLGLQEQLSPQRSNGFFSMLRRIHADASAASRQSRPH